MHAPTARKGRLFTRSALAMAVSAVLALGATSATANADGAVSTSDSVTALAALILARLIRALSAAWIVRKASRTRFSSQPPPAVRDALKIRMKTYDGRTAIM
jgi:hypothetical protein